MPYISNIRLGIKAFCGITIYVKASKIYHLVYKAY